MKLKNFTRTSGSLELLLTQIGRLCRLPDQQLQDGQGLFLDTMPHTKKRKKKQRTDLTVK